MWRKAIILFALFPMVMPILCARAADSMPSIEEAIANLPFQDADLEKLLAGEIVSYDLVNGKEHKLETHVIEFGMSGAETQITKEPKEMPSLFGG